MVATLVVSDSSEPLAPPAYSIASSSSSTLTQLPTRSQGHRTAQSFSCKVEVITRSDPELAPQLSRSRFNLARFGTPRWARRKASSVDIASVSTNRTVATEFAQAPRLELDLESNGGKSELAEKIQDAADMIGDEKTGHCIPSIEQPHIMVTAPTFPSPARSMPTCPSAPDLQCHTAPAHTHSTDDLSRANSASSSSSGASYSSTAPMMIPHAAHHHNRAYHHHHQIANLHSYAALQHHPDPAFPSSTQPAVPFRANKRVAYRRIHTDAETGLLSEKEPRTGWGCRSHAVGEGAELAYFICFVVFLVLVGFAWAAHTHWLAKQYREHRQGATIGGPDDDSHPPALF